MNIHLIQFDIAWENRDKNLQELDRLIGEVTGKTDLIVLPEMFTTGFSMNPGQWSEQLPGPSSQWMRNRAREKDCALTGSIMVRERGRFYNRMLFFTPEGKQYIYDKKHLFHFEKEDRSYTAGDRRTIVPFRGLRWNLQICYDLRFPVWSRNRGDYDVLIYIANWPASRMTVFDTLLKARAIENQCFVIGVNRVGQDGNPISYNGHSTVIDYKGRYLCPPVADRTAVLHARLDLQGLEDFRRKFPVWQDADDFELL